MIRAACLPFLLVVAACAPDPGFRGAHPAASYQSDLAACQSQAAAEADRIAKTRLYLFMTYPVSRLVIERQQVRVCLRGRGYIETTERGLAGTVVSRLG